MPKRGLSILLTVISLSLWAQNSVSPYSKLGIGEFTNQLYHRQLGFAGASMALYDPFNINTDNPASFSDLKFTTLQLGMAATRVRQEQENPALTINNGNSGLRYLAAGVPIKEWWGMALGFQPYTARGYNISSQRTLSSDTNIRISDSFTGSGGLNRIYFGHAFRPIKGLSIGANASYIFGRLRETNLVDFEPSGFLDTEEQITNLIQGFAFDYGVRYKYEFKNNLFASIGFSLRNRTNLSSENRSYAYTKSSSAIDTLVGGNEFEADWFLPSEYKFGISFGEVNPSFKQVAWAINADFEMYNGSEYEDAFGQNPYADAYRVEFGGFLTPAAISEKLVRSGGYLSKVEYRLGGYYGQSPLVVDGAQLDNYGISFGLGLPIKSRNPIPGEEKISPLDLGFRMGRQTSSQVDVIQETYFGFILGFSLSDRWFVDYKYR